jgi:intron-binding protein aquarius
VPVPDESRGRVEEAHCTAARHTTPNMQRPTVADLTSDENAYAQTARNTWLTAKAPKVLPGVVKEELYDRLEAESFPYNQLLLLEQLQCLERYLWPGYNEDASNQHVLLLALLANVKRRENLPVWSLFSERPDAFTTFFKRVLHMSIDTSLSTKTRTYLLDFIIGAFQSLDSGLVRKECAPLVSISTWHNLHSEIEREKILAKSNALQKAWRAVGRRVEQADAAGQARLRFERSWLFTLILDFLDNLYNTKAKGDQRNENLRYCERLVELLCDLQSQLPTRRYVNTLIKDLNTISAARLSPLYQDEDSGLLREMLELLAHYTTFPINDHSGRQLTRQEHDEDNNARIARLQKVALQQHPDKLKILILANFGLLAQRDELLGHIELLTDAEVLHVMRDLGLRSSYPEKSLVIQDRPFLLDVLVSAMEVKPYYTDVIRSMTTMPTEKVLYDKALLRTDSYDGSRPLAIPKVNLQYLTAGDFLWRSFVLYRSEAFFEIRKHIEDTVKRLRPKAQASGITRFEGFSRMAMPISKPAIIDTLPPRVGEDAPAEVKSEVILDVSRLQPGLRKEWETLRTGDVVFLLSVKPDDRSTTNGHANGDAAAEVAKLGLKAVRCAEVISVLDDHGKMMRFEQAQREDEHSRPRQRRLLLRLDSIAYKEDEERAKGDAMDGFNLVVRRRSRENNFKAVLESIKDLAVSDVPLPDWLQDVFLGYGDPSTASYQKLPNKLKSIDYRDTFVDWQHLVESLSGKTIEPDPSRDGSFPPPYVLEHTSSEPAPAPRPAKRRKRDAAADPESMAPAVEALKVSTYEPPNNGPYPTDAPKTNGVRFTPTQIEAVTAGTQPGLSLVVGPPGTGKTDVATQIISNIYHNFPEQRTLLIAHSNQALNQLFQKITALNIDERHLLRLGHGEEELETEASFSKAGRIESFMENAAIGLATVQRLAESISAPGAHGSRCETAAYFDQVYVQPLWKRFWAAVDVSEAEEDVATQFPFHYFFANAPQPLFPAGVSREELLEVARGCERHIRRIFAELEDIRPFEILRNQRDKANYLLVKEARIIAMTSTHAAMRRKEIAALGFHYDTVIMEEAAQLTEVENFIPLALQEPTISKDGKLVEKNLKRVVLVGDHLQNSPIVQNAAFKSYANLEQSLFLRLVRLGVPLTMLDAQGRARPSLAALYKWRYPHLTNLPITSTDPTFQRANAGLRYDFQFIDVPDYKDQGETEPSPHFIQNLGEAEYAVALYQYMRLLGYPAAKISILASYAGQKALIRDVLGHRCKGNRLFGMPGWVGTVDKYQGEQNDYVILSLTRTKSAGYLRDLRRLTVALSRARLGLYVFGRREVFESSLELRQAFEGLLARENTLQLVTGEMFPATRGVEEEVEATEMQGVEHLGQYVFEMTKAKVEDMKRGVQSLPAAEPEVQGRVEDDEEDEGGDGEENLVVDGEGEVEMDDAGVM